MLVRFYLRRIVDLNGISGEGIVGEGVLFSDGKCAIRWRHNIASTAVFDSLADLIFVHGHEGKSIIQFLDENNEGH